MAQAWLASIFAQSLAWTILPLIKSIYIQTVSGAIDAQLVISMPYQCPFQWEMKKASISMPGYNRRCPVAPLELGNWNFERMFTTHNMSQVMCHVSRVTYHVSRVTCHVFLCFLQIGEAYWWRVCYQPGLPRLVLTQCYNLHTSRELVSPVCGIFLWGISNSHSLFFKKLSPPQNPPTPPQVNLSTYCLYFFTFPNS